MSLPRVLIIGQPFTDNTGGGITLSNLFSGWNKDNLAVACSGYLLTDVINTNICYKYYQLGHKEKKWIFPFNLISRKYPSGLVKLDGRKAKNIAQPAPKLRVKLLKDYFNPLLDFIGLNNIAHSTDLSREFKEFLDEFQPDIVYAQASSRDGVRFCARVQDYLKKPFIFHMMDDWPSTIMDKTLFKTYWQRKLDKELNVLLQHTDLLLTICDEMSREYKRRYGKDSISFHNPTDLNFWRKAQRNDYGLSHKPTILYAGRTGLGINKSLITIAQAIGEANRQLGMELKFVLQTAEKPHWTEKYPWVTHQNLVAYEELPNVFSQADFLVLPYDFSEKSVKYIRISMPTKASEYMVSGTPILIFAPEETAIVKYANEHRWAKVVVHNQVDALVEAIKSLVLNEEDRKHIAQTAIALAESRHDSVTVTKEFQSAIRSLVVSSLNVENEE